MTNNIVMTFNLLVCYENPFVKMWKSIFYLIFLYKKTLTNDDMSTFVSVLSVKNIYSFVSILQLGRAYLSTHGSAGKLSNTYYIRGFHYLKSITDSDFKVSDVVIPYPFLYCSALSLNIFSSWGFFYFQFLQGANYSSIFRCREY